MRDFLHENGKKPIGIQYELFVKTRKIIQTASPWSVKWDSNRFPKMGIHVLSVGGKLSLLNDQLGWQTVE